MEQATSFMKILSDSRHQKQNNLNGNFTFLDVAPDLRINKATLIDLRSPREFAKGHIVYAHNIPLLDNHERHIVGLTYRKQGRIEAVQTGLEIFSGKVETFFSQIDSLHPNKDNAIILYCWRGGLRSEAAATLLEASGYKVKRLHGGYKFYRNQVLEILSKLAKHSLIVLNSSGGNGRTAQERRGVFNWTSSGLIARAHSASSCA